MRQFDLQNALFRAGALAENLQNQRGAVDDLALPSAFQVALLHGRQSAIRNDQRGFVSLDDSGDFLDLPLAQKRCGTKRFDGDGNRVRYVQFDRRRQIFRFFQARVNGTRRRGRGVVFQVRVDNQRAFLHQTSFSKSKSTGAAGITVDTECLYTSCV